MGADPTTDAIDSGIDSGSDSSGSVSSGSRPSSLTEDEAEDLDGAACQNDRDGTECPENDSYRTECQNDGTECQEKDRGNTEGQEKDRDGCDHYRRKARLVVSKKARHHYITCLLSALASDITIQDILHCISSCQ